MVSLTVDSGCRRISNILNANSAYKISKMALLFAKAEFKIAFSSHLSTSILNFKDISRTILAKVGGGGNAAQTTVATPRGTTLHW